MIVYYHIWEGNSPLGESDWTEVYTASNGMQMATHLKFAVAPRDPANHEALIRKSSKQ